MSGFDLERKFPNLKLGGSAPAMFRVNDCGTLVYGRRDFDDETGTYVKTYGISLVVIPVFALTAYRVSDAARGWYFIGREPLSAFAVLRSSLGCVPCSRIGVFERHHCGSRFALRQTPTRRRRAVVLHAVRACERRRTRRDGPPVHSSADQGRFAHRGHP